MRALLIPLLLVPLVACSTTQLPISPHKIDVQQGNVIEQDRLDKLKPGLTRSQVRFLLGTPLVVDPFRDNRWDYVYNYRTAGKLTAEKRLTVFFDGDVLSKIETKGYDHPEPQGELAAAKSASASAEPQVAAAAAQAKETQAQPAQVAAVPETSTKPSTDVPSVQSSSVKTSIVPPLEPVKKKAAVVKADSVEPQPVALQNDKDTEAIKPDVVPSLAEAKVTSDVESPVLAAVHNWAKAWSARDDQGYLAAYSQDFRPAGGFTRPEWAKRRKMLLNLSRHIEVRIDSPVVEFPDEGHALVTFNQYYRSDSYHDAVIKQLLMGLQGGHWLILEERVMSPLNIIKK